MKEYLEKKYGIEFKDDPMGLGSLLFMNGNVFKVPYELITYQPITHEEEDGMEYCECDCGHNHHATKYKTVVDVAVADLTEEQQAEQRKGVEDMIDNLIKRAKG